MIIKLGCRKPGTNEGEQDGAYVIALGQDDVFACLYDNNEEIMAMPDIRWEDALVFYENYLQLGWQKMTPQDLTYTTRYIL